MTVKLVRPVNSIRPVLTRVRGVKIHGVCLGGGAGIERKVNGRRGVLKLTMP